MRGRNGLRSKLRCAIWSPPLALTLLCVTEAQAAQKHARDRSFFQYGVALVAEFVATTGRLCPGGAACIFGSGGGIAARGGWRASNQWYFGGVYEVSKHDAHTLYRLATFQQLRGEARYYIWTTRSTQPVFTLGGGLAGLGNELGIDAWGPIGSCAVGFESEVSNNVGLGLAVAYRAAMFNSFTDSAGTRRYGGPVQMIGIELSIDLLDRSGGAW